MAIHYLSFVNENDFDQVDWAINYLIKMKLIPAPLSEPPSADYLGRTLHHMLAQKVTDPAKAAALHGKMLNAWNSRKKRKRDNATFINIPVQRGIKNKFNALASQSGLTQAELFSNLVSRAATLESDKRAEIEQIKRDLRQKRQKPTEKVQPTSKHSEANTTDTDVSLNLLISLAHEMCQAEVILEAKEAGAASPTTERLQQASAQADKLIKALTTVRSHHLATAHTPDGEHTEPPRSELEDMIKNDLK